MRTTLDLPDALLRHLKAQAALDGATLKDTIRTLVERGMSVAATPPPKPRARVRSPLPSIKIGRPLRLKNPSNAALFALLDE
jgi:hypothetical protein